MPLVSKRAQLPTGNSKELTNDTGGYLDAEQLLQDTRCEEKAHYKEKFETVGFSINKDPYVPSNAERYRSDMNQWPKIEYGHVFTYFISRPGFKGPDNAHKAWMIAKKEGQIICAH